jgi:hypothetical protein
MLNLKESNAAGFTLSRKQFEALTLKTVDNALLFQMTEGVDYCHSRSNLGSPTIRFSEKALKPSTENHQPTEQKITETVDPVPSAIANKILENVIIEKLPPNQKLVVLKDGRLANCTDNQKLKRGMKVRATVDRHGRLMILGA